MKVKDIASKYQVTKQTIVNIIRGNNVPMRKEAERGLGEIKLLRLSKD